MQIAHVCSGGGGIILPPTSCACVCESFHPVHSSLLRAIRRPGALAGTKVTMWRGFPKGNKTKDGARASGRDQAAVRPSDRLRTQTFRPGVQGAIYASVLQFTILIAFTLMKLSA